MTLPLVDLSTGAQRSRGVDAVWRRYGEFLRRPPLLTVEWADRETSARGWLVINSLRGGAAGGGTRMRNGLGPREVVYLAKTMELKFLFSGPAIGGAKSGIDFDPSDPRRPAVLRRWFRAVHPHIQAHYGTGGDLNVDELLDVIPCCSELGLAHPQEGIVRGHLQARESQLDRICSSLDRGVKAPADNDFGIPGLAVPVADLITGYGLARSILRLFEEQGRTIEGARVVIEGFGAVGGPCALYLARAGMHVVGVADREKCLIEEGGLSPADVEHLLRHREDKCLPSADPRCLRDADRERFATVPADIFVAAAASGTLDRTRLERLAAQGISTVACGANQPFAEAKLGATTVQRFADERFSVIPDVVANCGMARALSFFMENPEFQETSDIFEAVNRTIDGAVHEISARSGGLPSGLMAATLNYALDELEADERPRIT